MMSLLPLAALAAVAVISAGCTSPPPGLEPAQPVALPPPVGNPYPDNERRVQFRCQNGETLAVRFFRAQGVAVLVRQGRNHELQQQVTASGFHYEGAGYEVRGKGDALRLLQGTAAPLECTATDSTSQGSTQPR